MSVWLIAGAAYAAPEVGVVTLADAGTRVLRGAAWYKLPPGLALEDGDIVTGDSKAHAQLEFPGGTIVSLAGEGSLLQVLQYEPCR